MHAFIGEHKVILTFTGKKKYNNSPQKGNAHPIINVQKEAIANKICEMFVHWLQQIHKMQMYRYIQLRMLLLITYLCIYLETRHPMDINMCL